MPVPAFWTPHIRALSKRIRSGSPGKGPLMLELILMENVCNQACVMCPLSLPSPAPREMDQGLADRLIDQVEAPHGIVKLIAWGEPLLARGFERTASRILDRGLGLSVHTNGLLLPRSAAVSRGLREGRVHLTISIDASQAATYSLLRPTKAPGDAFERMKESVRACDAMRRGAGNANASLAASFIVMRSNYAEMPDFVELCSGLGFDSVSFRHVFAMPPTDPAESMAADPAACDRSALRALDAAFEAGLHIPPQTVARLIFDADLARRYALRAHVLSLDKDTARLQPGSSARFCFKPWYYLRADRDGTVRPCCTAGHFPPAYGSAADSPLEDLWSSPSYAGLRADISAGRRGPMCAACRIDENGSPGAAASHFLETQRASAPSGRRPGSCFFSRARATRPSGWDGTSTAPCPT